MRTIAKHLQFCGFKVILSDEFFVSFSFSLSKVPSNVAIRWEVPLVAFSIKKINHLGIC